MSDDVDLRTQSLLLTIAQNIVDYPGDVVIRVSIIGDTRTFQISCNPADTGKLIGSKGRTARAIRTLTAAIAMMHHRRYVIDIAEA